jgi:hypothetical protein
MPFDSWTEPLTGFFFVLLVAALALLTAYLWFF